MIALPMAESRKVPAWVVKARQAWSRAQRPDNIVTPGANQESVWDYPRPPVIQNVSTSVRVLFGGEVIAETRRAKRVCETASPPTYYLPPADVDRECLLPLTRSSLCEWKGEAAYFDVQAGGQQALAAVWCYPKPFEEFAVIAGWMSFMPAVMDACYVGDHAVIAQPGGFYGGWITPELTGPFKGEPGTGHW